MVGFRQRSNQRGNTILELALAVGKEQDHVESIEIPEPFQLLIAGPKRRGGIGKAAARKIAQFIAERR